VPDPQPFVLEKSMAKTQWIRIIARTMLVTSLIASATIATAAEEKKLSPVESGKKIAFDKTKGNCLACHMIADGVSPGEIGPHLMAMQARYPDKQKLFDKIWGKPGVELMPESQMLPFGKNKALTDAEISDIVEFLYTL
jgi:sulfur-oxidizing protein SoxX